MTGLPSTAELLLKADWERPRSQQKGLGMSDLGEVRNQVAFMLERNHEDYIQRNRAIFLEFPPSDFAPYAYTYYDGNGNPIYHGYTTDAQRRAKEHYERAPWASWIEDVRYRRCRTAYAARRLEGRLMKKVPALFRFAYHGCLWPDIEGQVLINHVKGTCKRPGGICDIEYIMRSIQDGNTP